MFRGWNIMFLHLGGEIVVYTKDIIAILDVDSTLKSKDSKEFFNTCEEEGFVVKVSDEEPRSFVITERVENKGSKRNNIRKIMVYYSPISSNTLQKRADFTTTITHNLY